jgi:hypothetical protein
MYLNFKSEICNFQHFVEVLNTFKTFLNSGCSSKGQVPYSFQQSFVNYFLNRI